MEFQCKAHLKIQVQTVFHFQILNEDDFDSDDNLSMSGIRDLDFEGETMGAFGNGFDLNDDSDDASQFGCDSMLKGFGNNEEPFGGRSSIIGFGSSNDLALSHNNFGASNVLPLSNDFGSSISGFGLNNNFGASNDFSNIHLYGQSLSENNFDDRSISSFGSRSSKARKKTKANPIGMVGYGNSLGSMSGLSDFTLSPSNPGVLSSYPQYSQPTASDKMKRLKDRISSQPTYGSLNIDGNSFDFSTGASSSRKKGKKKKATATSPSFNE